MLHLLSRRARVCRWEKATFSKILCRNSYYLVCPLLQTVWSHNKTRVFIRSSVPELPPVIEGSDAVFYSNKSPSFEQATPQSVVSGGLRLCTDSDTSTQQHIVNLSNDLSNVTFEKVFNPIEDLNVPFETGYCTIRQLGLVKPRLFGKLYSKFDTYFSAHREYRFQDPILYDIVQNLLQNEQKSKLQDWQQTLLKNYSIFGKHNGSHLSPEDLDQLRLLNGKLAQHQYSFAQKVLYATKTFNYLELDPFAFDGVPYHMKQQYAVDKAKPDSGPWKLDLSDRTFQMVMTHVPNRNMRKLMFEAFYGRASPTSDRLNRNVENIVQITRKRKLIAKFLGYSCFSDLILETKMAEKKENVQSFIEAVRSKIRPMHDEDILQLTAFAQEKSKKSKEYSTLQAWDIAYWRQQQCQELLTSLKVDQANISRYFSYDNVLKGVFRFVEHLFGVQFRIDESFGDEYKWHPDVQVYQCIENGETIGHLMIDPYARPNEKSDLCLAIPGRDRCQRHNILPVAYLNMSLPRIEGTVTLMTLTQLKELFFAFGRVLQIILTRSPNHELSGVRALEADTMDVIPHFMVQWLRDPSILSFISEHVETKKTLDANTYQRALNQIDQHMMTHDVLRQLYLSALDLEIHTNATNYFDAMTKLWPLFTSIPLHNRDFHPCSFEQIFCEQFASCYYSHKWSEMVACDLFSAFKEANVHDNEKVSQLGRKFRETILARSGTVSMRQLFREFRSREPNYDDYLRFLTTRS